MVAEVLARLVPRLPHDHPGLHALMERLYDASVDAAACPDTPELRAWLAGYAGSSKGAIHARRLLAELDGFR